MIFEMICKLFMGTVAMVFAIVSFIFFIDIGIPVLALLSIIFWMVVAVIYFKQNSVNINSSNDNLYTEMDKHNQTVDELKFNGFDPNNYSNINHAVNDMHAMWDEMD